MLENNFKQINLKTKTKLNIPFLNKFVLKEDILPNSMMLKFFDISKLKKKKKHHRKIENDWLVVATVNMTSTFLTDVHILSFWNFKDLVFDFFFF